VDYWKHYWETPMMAYWRRLNAELERLGAKPVLFGDAFVAYGSCRDPVRAARTIVAHQTAGAAAGASPVNA
jgi:hypothetical protein